MDLWRQARPSGRRARRPSPLLIEFAKYWVLRKEALAKILKLRGLLSRNSFLRLRKHRKLIERNKKDPYRFFHPPRCPGAPPLERGAGPNSGPDWAESVGWKIWLRLLAPDSSAW